ncbi:MAG: pyrroline-5-carboxylate reductase [Gemmatimonas sp.]|nr:pyrroline-5-carboxylate reductase [Gemmatimonas sp.]
MPLRRPQLSRGGRSFSHFRQGPHVPDVPRIALASAEIHTDASRSSTSQVEVRAATQGDLRRIADLLAVFVRLRLVRARSAAELQRELGNFLVAEVEGAVVGCVSLRIHSPSLAEVASLAVEEGHHGLGIGRRLVQAAVLRSHARGVRRVFAFTMRENLFLQLGFRSVPVTDFPQKLVTDYGGIALAAGRKAAVVLDLEASQIRALPPRLPPPAERGGGPITVMKDDRPAPNMRDNSQRKRPEMSDVERGNRTIAILGGGNLGRALAMGWVESGYCSADRIRITRRNPDKLTFFAEAGFLVGSDNLEAIRDANTVILAVQPQQVADLAEEIREAIDPDQHRIISVASGVSIRQLRELLDTRASIVRAMPNTAVSIGQSMTCISSSHSDDPALPEAVELFDIVGRTLVIEETMMIPATALCACGIAFFLRSIRAASQGGIEIGFHPEEALLLAAQTAKGAAMLVLDQGRHPESEIDQVTTPRGCTIAGLNEMEHQGFSSALIKGILLSATKAEGLYAD